MPNEALEEIRQIEAALPADLSRGRDYPTVDPATGRWTELTPPELPTERRPAVTLRVPAASPATPTNSGSRVPSSRRRRSSTVGSRRRLLGSSLPTVEEIRAFGGFDLGGLPRLPPPPPPPPTRPPPLPPTRPPPPPPIRPREQEPQQGQPQQEIPAAATDGGEDDSDSSSDFGQGPLVQGNSTTQGRRGRRGGSGVRDFFAGLRRSRGRGSAEDEKQEQ